MTNNDNFLTYDEPMQYVSLNYPTGGHIQNALFIEPHGLYPPAITLDFHGSLELWNKSI